MLGRCERYTRGSSHGSFDPPRGSLAIAERLRHAPLPALSALQRGLDPESRPARGLGPANISTSDFSASASAATPPVRSLAALTNDGVLARVPARAGLGTLTTGACGSSTDPTSGRVGIGAETPRGSAVGEMLGRIGSIVRATRGMATPTDSRSETARRSVSRKGRLCRFDDSRSPVDGATGAGRPTTPADPFNPAADGPAPTLGGSVKRPSDARAAWPVEYCQANVAASARPTAAIVILRTPHHTAGPACAITQAYRGRTARFATRPGPATCSRRHADPSTVRHALAGIRGIAPARRDFSSRSLGGTRGASAHVMLNERLPTSADHGRRHRHPHAAAPRDDRPRHHQSDGPRRHHHHPRLHRPRLQRTDAAHARRSP
jgi:hypothetical protein